MLNIILGFFFVVSVTSKIFLPEIGTNPQEQKIWEMSLGNFGSEFFSFSEKKFTV